MSTDLFPERLLPINTDNIFVSLKFWKSHKRTPHYCDSFTANYFCDTKNSKLSLYCDTFTFITSKVTIKKLREYDVAFLGTSDSNVAPCERHFTKRKNIKIKEKNCTIHRLHGGGRLVLSCPENKAPRMETSDLLAIL